MKTYKKKFILSALCFLIFTNSFSQIEEFYDNRGMPIRDYKMLHDLSPSIGIQPFPYQADWDSVFFDNFDDISSLENWTPKESPRGHQLCLFQDSTRNISIDTIEKKLYITPIKENVFYVKDNGAYKKQYYYTSGELKSNAEFRYGYFEIRCKLPRFKGAHPAFWLFGVEPGGGDDRWEIDILEASSSNPMETRRNSFTANYSQYKNPNNNPGRDNSVGFFMNNDEPTNSLSDKFYTYALEWTPYELTYYIDNRIIRRVPIDTLDPTSLIHAMYPCQVRICLEIDWWNPPDEETDLEPFIIDYVRVYKKNAGIYIPKPEINGNEIVTYDWNTYSVEDPDPNGIYTWEIDNKGELNPINPYSVQARLKSDSTTAVLTLREEIEEIDDTLTATNQKIITNRLPTEFRSRVNFWICNNPYTELEVQHNNQNNLPPDTTNLINKFKLFNANTLGDTVDNSIYTTQSNDIDSNFKINDHVIPDSTYVVEHELSSDQYYSKSRRIIYPTLNSAFCPIVWDENDPKNVWAKSVVKHANNLWKLYQCDSAGNDTSLIYQVDIPPPPPSVPHLDFCYYLDNQESEYYYLDHTTYLENNDCFPDKTRRMYFYTKDAENIDPENINCYIPFRKYPYILLKEDSVTVMWQLYSNLNCTFYYKRSVDPEFIEVQVNEPYTEYFLYKYELTDLDPGILYDFKVVVEITYPFEKTDSFISSPDSTETQISFYGYGDTRGDSSYGEPPFHDEVCYKVVDEINNDPTSQTLIIHSGDWNYDDSEEMWDAQYFLKEDDNAVELRTKIGVVGCIGNHEANYGEAPNYRKYWPYNYPDAEPDFWHSFDYGPVHFCFADQRWENYTLGNANTQKGWIKSDLEDSNKPWKVLVFHPPVYTCAKDPNDYNCEKDFYDSILNDPEKYGVNMVLNGHVHKYSNWLVNGVHHLTLGGGGAHRDGEVPLEEDDPNNPDIIRWYKAWHFVKFEVHNDYIKVKVPYSDDTSNWDILDEFIIPHSFVIDSGENIVWEDHGCHYYADSIRVKTGGVLTIKGDVEFQRDGGIIVEPGGRLIVDSALLTCLGDYNDDESYWQGIQVWGNSSVHQFPDTNGNYQQGYLKLKNGAIIENAVSAVELWRPDHWGTQGGIVFADNTTFRNNTKSVHALYYQNYHPYDTAQEMNYRGSFKDCTFEIDTNYSGEHKFYKHVDLSHVKGIDFQACDFYLADNVEGVSDWSSGIFSSDAGFRVDYYCDSQQIPCPDTSYVRPYFSGFKHAIFATTDGSTTNSFSIDHADFVNNACGVKIMRVNNAIILRSDFEIGFNNNSEECEACDGYYNSYGIILDNATGFAIEENNFTKLQGAPIGNYIGIIINNTQASDEVYLNTFDGISYANFAQGKNWGDYTYEGLAYFCNQNTANYADFYVVKDVNNIGGIQSNQGDNENVTGNKFSQTDATWHFFNDGNYRIDYYYCDSCTNENPDSAKIYQVNEIDKNFNNPCPSHYGGGSSGSERELVLSPQQKQQAEQEFALNLSDYNSVKALYDNLTDGGNTNSELSDIQTAQPGDMWALRTQLLGDSPHLSMEVLKAAADKTDVFPESVVFDIMAANPDELRKEELIKFLEDKENPLPDYMINILRQVANGITYKTVLQQQMSRYNRNKTRAAYDIIRSNLNDTITDFTELRNWLDNVGGIRADEQIIASYIQEGNYTDALSLANMLPALYDMEGDDLTEHNYYMDILNLHFNLQQQGRNILELDSVEVANIITIAENSNGTAGVQARSILEYGYGYNYFNCPDFNDTAGYKISNFNMEDFTRMYGIEITVKPNPARGWTAFNYQLPDDMSKGVITITDVYGKLIETIAISGNKGQRIWDTRSIKAGIYFYTLNTAGFSKSSKLIINK